MKLKHFMAALALVGAGLMATAPAHAARGGAIYSSGDTITQIADLKDEAPQEKANLGWKHYQFSLFWMPLWAGDGSYVLYEETDDGYSYNDVTEEQAKGLASASGMEAAPPGPLSLYWGWLVALGLIGFIFLKGRRA